MENQPGERTHLVIMFIDICGSSVLASKLEPERYNEILEHLRGEVQRVTDLHSGNIIRIDGDGFILTFGHKPTDKSASQNAIQSALNIHKFVEDITPDIFYDNSKILIRTAIHSGIVLVKKGNLKTGVIEILGDPTNTTSHLCNNISPGDIAITCETITPHSPSFKNVLEKTLFIPKLQKTVKFKLINQTVKNQRHIDNLTYFVGRNQTLQKMRDFIQSNTEAQYALMITAPAGIGKSRLLNEFSYLTTSNDLIIHQGMCESYLGTQTLQPIEQIIRSIKLFTEQQSEQYNESDFKKIIQRLNDILSLIKQSRTSNVELNVLINQLTQYIKNYSAQEFDKTICFVIDDWQWIDDTSKLVVNDLFKNRHINLKFIFAARSEDQLFVDMNNIKVLPLQPLTKLQVEKIAMSLIPGIEPFSIMRIQNHCGGNPLFLEELCHAIRDSRFNVQPYSTESWLESLIYTRYSQLPFNLKNIVKAASVIGFFIPVGLLELIVGENLSEIDIKNLAKADFLYPSDTPNHIRFKHLTTQTVIYKMIGLKEKNDIHSQIIEQLIIKSKQHPAQSQHGQLAYHYKQKGDFKKSISHSKVAGNAALNTSSLDKAQAHYRNALQLTHKCKISELERLEILKNYGRACIVDPANEHLPLLIDTLKYSKEVQNNELTLWSEYWLGFLLYGLGYPQKSVEHFESCDKLAKSLNNFGLEIQLKANLGQAYAAACNYQKAYKYLDESISLKYKKNKDKRVSASLAYAISCKGFALGEQGYFTRAESCFEEAQNALRRKLHVASTSILNQKAVVNLWHGNIDACLDITAKTENMSKIMRSRYNYAQSIFLTSAAKFSMSHNDDHLSRMIQSTNWLVYDGVGQNLSLNYGAITEALALKQDWSKLRIYAARGLRRARLGDKRSESQILRSLAIAAKAGETYKSQKVYMQLAQKSAVERGSIREMENNENLKSFLT